MKKLGSGLYVPNNLGQVSGGLVAEFDPATYGTVLAWYAARKEAYSDDDSVTLVTDQGPNGLDATPPAAANRPVFKTGIIGGQPIYRGDADDRAVASDIGTGHSCGTVFMVYANPSVALGVTATLTVTGPTNKRLFTHFADVNTVYAGDASELWGTDHNTLVDGVDTNDLVDGSAKVVEQYSTTSAAGLLDNGALTLWYAIDNNAHLSADVAEVILFENILSAWNRNSVRKALSAIYGISVS
jgi:hypothetical protein